MFGLQGHPKIWCVIGSIIAEQPHTNCAVEGWNSALNRDAPLIPNLWKLIRRFKKLEATAMQEWRGLVNFVFVNVKPTSLSVCQVGAGNLNNKRKGNKYHSAKAKNDRSS